ncbi:MAG: response regulator [Acidobacteriota bacterium]|nr:response regulator [Acidobacteriota bacterium]
MSIRIKAILSMIVVVLVILAANFGFSYVFTRARLLETVEQDLSVVSEFANKLVATKIYLLKADAATIAQHLLTAETDGQLQEMLDQQLGNYSDFLALTVFDRTHRIAYSGTLPTPESRLQEVYLQRAFDGEPNISTTRVNRHPDKLVMHVCVPMGKNRALSVTLSGMLLSDFLSEFDVWKTGNVFILDEKGTFIAGRQEKWVLERAPYTNLANDSHSGARSVEFFKQVLDPKTPKGVGYFDYSVDGKKDTRRICAYTRITGSQWGWILGVQAPLSESPAAQLRGGLLLSAGLLLLLGVAISVVASSGVAKPFHLIEEQNQNLLELNEVVKHTSEAKSAFLANMSHEMRTPMNAIIGLSELMLDNDEVPGEVRENINKVYTSGVTLLEIINDILDISKIEAGKFEIIPVEYDTPSLINDIVTLNIMRIGSKPIKFNLQIDETLPSMLRGDDLRIKQVCNNLLSNAFKYTKEGNVYWSLTCERDGDDVWLTISVKDSGIGIREEDVERLFSDYNQVDTKSNRMVEGTGLGLSITKNLVAMMDGRITVESEYGHGSTFTVRIRQGAVTDEPIGHDIATTLKNFNYIDNKRKQNAKFVRKPIPYARVLVVDDIPTNLDVAKGLMKPYGMRIDCVTSGQLAIDLIRKAEVRYNAIFMDHMMPGMDGIEATRIIREEIGTEYAKTVPIIALTANAISGNDKMFLEHGFQDFLSKPIDVVRMDAVMRTWVRDKELEKELADKVGGADILERRNGADRREHDERRDGVERRRDDDGSWIAKNKMNGKINLVQALDRFGDDKGALLQVLRSYVVNTQSLLDSIREVSEQTLADYAITVHGIKGSSRSICAEPVGASAEELEHAAKAGDLSLVLGRNVAFLAEAEGLIRDLAKIIRDADAENEKPILDKPDHDVLCKLQAACASFEMDSVDAAMDTLESYTYTADDDLVVWLRERVDRMEFQEIQERLSDF